MHLWNERDSSINSPILYTEFILTDNFKNILQSLNYLTFGLKLQYMY